MKENAEQAGQHDDDAQRLCDLRFLLSEVSPEIQRLAFGAMALARYRNQLGPERRRIWNFFESFIRDFMEEPEFLESFGPDVKSLEILKRLQEERPS